MDIIKIQSESFDFTDGNGKPYPAFRTCGCGCCSVSLPITQKYIDEAIQQTREWLEELESLQPFDYPPDVEIPKT